MKMNGKDRITILEDKYNSMEDTDYKKLQLWGKIEMLKRKGDKSYLEYEKMISDIVKIIHKQNGVKELIQQSVKPNGKYILFNHWLCFILPLKRPHFFPEQKNHCQNGSQLNQNKKHFLKLFPHI